MALNRISNPSKVRAIAGLIGEPVARAVARYFVDQHLVLVFGASGRQYTVDVKSKQVKPYAEDPPLVLVEGGITGGGRRVDGGGT